MSFLNRIDLRSRASAALRELVEATGETVHLGIPDREHVIYVEKLEGTNALQMRSRVGTRMPLYSTGLGKAILAFAENSAAQAVAAKPLKQRTPNTITSTAELNRELERVRERGYAFDFEENEVGIRCVGVPIFDYSGQVVAGVSVAGPAFQFTEERLDELAHLACRTAADISTELGWVGADTESRREATST
jgi:IclR family KDG regulon transcriptional repressor